MLYRKINFIKLLFSGTLCLTILTGCSVQQMLLQNAGNLLSKETTSGDDDIELLRHASAYHLKLSESLLQEIPTHTQLAESIVRGYTQYAFVYFMDEADQVESDSVQKASQLRSRAAQMLLRAKSIGFKNLKLKYPQLDSYLQGQISPQSLNLSINDVGLTYWSMTSWAGAISLSKDSPDIVADLPSVVRLAELAWHVNPQYENGALASMMGTLELARPGGKPETAEKYFDLAIQWRGAQIAPLISKAENWAVATQNKAVFKQLLTNAIDSSHAQNDLSNRVMRKRAQWLLDSIDNFF